MTLPVVCDDSAEHELGTTSLEMVRGRLLGEIKNNPDLSRRQRKRIIAELDFLIENEQSRRKQMAVHQWQREELEHRLVIAEKYEAICQKYAAIVSKLRLLKARTHRAVARYERDSTMCRLEVIERLLQIKDKYKSVEKQDEQLKELSRIRRQLEVSEAKEQAILESIAKRALSRAAFIKMVNEKFPDMADELLEFYDQQLFQQGTRR